MGGLVTALSALVVATIGGLWWRARDGRIRAVAMAQKRGGPDLTLVLLFQSGWLALAQAAVFAVTALWPRYSPYGLVYRIAVAPRLPRPTELEPAAPVRFAQALGLGFTTVATLGYLLGAPVLGLVFAASALVAAFLNAAFGLCLGCEFYLAFRRLTRGEVPARRVPAREA